MDDETKSSSTEDNIEVKKRRLPRRASELSRSTKRPIENYCIITSTSLRNTTKASSHEEQQTSSSGGEKVTHFYEKHGDTIVYYNDENLIGAVESATTTLTSALQHHSRQVANAPSTRAQRQKEITAATEDEPCHQRRYMAQEQLLRTASVDHALWQGQERLIKTLKVKKLVHTRLTHRVNDALRASQMLLNLKAFVIFHESGIYAPYTPNVMYESMRNDYAHRIITLDELMCDLMQLRKDLQEEVFKEILHTCFFLEDPARPLNYMIYKREIEYVGEKPLEKSTPLWARWFLPHRNGYYYAIIVNFARSERNVPVRPPEYVCREFCDEERQSI